jgi:hypothetical protein
MADYVYEVACTGERSRQGSVQTWFDTTAASAWTTLPGLSAVDIYSVFSGAAHDPFVDDGLGPLLLAMLQFSTADQMSRATSDPAFERSLDGCPSGIDVTGTPFERRFYPVASEPAGPLSVPFSYVVRYHRPAEDEAAFVANYLDTHPKLLGQLPRIRSVLCYMPLLPAPKVLPAADYMIGNEVAFDNVDDFNAAMASPIRQEARRHFHNFPPFTGRNTHYPMLRRQVLRQPS